MLLEPVNQNFTGVNVKSYTQVNEILHSVKKGKWELGMIASNEEKF